MKKLWLRFIKYLKSDSRVFARGLSKEKLFFVFVFGCVFGCIYEEILNTFVVYMQSGDLIFETRRGLIYGELSPVYGFGAIIMLKILMKKKRTWYEVYGYGSLIGGAFEYIASFLQEKFTGSLSWDYTGYFLNINGRTTIPFMLIWGLGAIILIYILYPFLSYCIEKIPYNLGRIIYFLMVIIISLDIFISFGAAIRQGVRRAGYGPYTVLDKFYDKYYPDERLAKVFKNAVLK